MVPVGLRCCLGQRMVLLRPDASLINGRFLLMALQSPAVQRQIMMHEGTGSTVSNLRIPALKALKISLPSQQEQFAVAELLGALDDKIELNRRTSETLEAMACGKLDEWEQEALIAPADWESIPLGQCGVWLSGGTPNRAVTRYWGGGIPWISAKSLKNFVVSDSEERVTQEGAENGTRVVPERSVVFVVRGMSLADEFRVGVTSSVVTINQDVKAIIPSHRVSGPLIGYALRRASRDVLRLADEASHGTKRLETERVKRVPVLVPLRTHRQRDIDLLDLLFRRQVVCQSENKSLAALRETLLPRLLTGELHIRDAEREVALAT